MKTKCWYRGRAKPIAETEAARRTSLEHHGTLRAGLNKNVWFSEKDYHGI